MARNATTIGTEIGRTWKGRRFAEDSRMEGETRLEVEEQEMAELCVRVVVQCGVASRMGYSWCYAWVGPGRLWVGCVIHVHYRHADRQEPNGKQEPTGGMALSDGVPYETGSTQSCSRGSRLLANCD